jgi:hypothetical protein
MTALPAPTDDVPPFEYLVDPAGYAARLIHAKVAARGGPRQPDWADGTNPFARPNPDLPWVDRLLPPLSCALGRVVHLGHERTVHDFAVPSCCATGSKPGQWG